jgi:hypothetical protein
MAYGKSIAIGDLRWPVYLATRQQVAQANSTGIDEFLQSQTQVYASIEPIGLMAWIAGEQLDTPGPTHRLTIRFSDNLDMFDVVIRQLVRDDGSDRTETFRIRRTAEVQGRQRFSILDCELESRQG